MSINSLITCMWVGGVNDQTDGMEEDGGGVRGGERDE